MMLDHPANLQRSFKNALFIINEAFWSKDSYFAISYDDALASQAAALPFPNYRCHLQYFLVF